MSAKPEPAQSGSEDDDVCVQCGYDRADHEDGDCPEIRKHDHACCPPDDCCGGPCAAHPCWELTTDA